MGIVEVTLDLGRWGQALQPSCQGRIMIKKNLPNTSQESSEKKNYKQDWAKAFPPIPRWSQGEGGLTGHYFAAHFCFPQEESDISSKMRLHNSIFIRKKKKMFVSMESKIQSIANNSTDPHTDLWYFACVQCTGFMTFFCFTSLKMTQGLPFHTSAKQLFLLS